MDLAHTLLGTPALQSFVKRVPSKTRLFRQGEMGQSLIVVADGIVEVLAESEGGESQIAIVQPGELLGEQAFIQPSPYRRAFTARALTETLYLELGHYEISVLQKKSPGVMVTVMRSILQIAANRLTVANDLARSLSSSDNMERLVKLIVHFHTVSGRMTKDGVQVLLAPERFTYYTDMDRAYVKRCLTALEHRRLVRSLGKDYYLVPDTTELLNAIPSLARILSAA